MNELNLLNGILELVWDEVCDCDSYKYTKLLKRAGFSAKEAYSDLHIGVGLTPNEAFDEVEAVYEDVTREEVTGIREGMGDCRAFEPYYEREA